MPGSVRVSQQRNEALTLLGASLRCDRIARRWQFAYWLLILLGLTLLAVGPFVPTHFSDATTALAVAQGAAAIFAFQRMARWRGRGSILRADYERSVFGFPDWQAQRGELDADVPALHRAHVGRGGASSTRLRTWFAPPAGLTHDQEVLACQHESLVYGQRLRVIWAGLMAGLSCLLALLSIVMTAVVWPLDGHDWYLLIVPAAALSTSISETVSAFRYSLDRRELAILIEKIAADPAVDSHRAGPILHERVVAVRQNRVLVPNMVYALSRRSLSLFGSAPPPFPRRDGAHS